jgi:hypothetical protein
MKTMAFDGIVREMSEVSTRRGVFRLLGGAAAMSAGLVLGGESLAKGKNHGKATVQGRQARGKGKGAVQTQGKKGAKITICYQTQTRTVKKKGYQRSLSRGHARRLPGSGSTATAATNTTTSRLHHVDSLGGPEPTARSRSMMICGSTTNHNRPRTLSSCSGTTTGSPARSSGDLHCTGG